MVGKVKCPKCEKRSISLKQLIIYPYAKCSSCGATVEKKKPSKIVKYDTFSHLFFLLIYILILTYGFSPPVLKWEFHVSRENVTLFLTTIFILNLFYALANTAFKCVFGEYRLRVSDQNEKWRKMPASFYLSILFGIFIIVINVIDAVNQ